MEISLDITHLAWLPILLIVVLLSLPLVTTSKSSLHYHGCYAVYTFITSSIALVMIPVFSLTPKHPKNIRNASLILKYISPLIGINWEIRNPEILSEDRGAIIVSNHQSILDVLGMLEYWKLIDKMTVIAKKELFYTGPFGLGAWLGGLIFINRSNPDEAKRSMNEATRILNLQKIKLWIFPEGTRNDKLKMLPFKKGAFAAAIANQMPIIPVVYSPYYFIDHKKKYFGKGRMIMTVLPAISTKGLTFKDMDDLITRTKNIMEETFETVSKELITSK